MRRQSRSPSAANAWASDIRSAGAPINSEGNRPRNAGQLDAVFDQKWLAADNGLHWLQLSWGSPNDVEVQWLLSKGVSCNALPSPWPVGATNALFAGRTFELAPHGERCLTWTVFDRGEPLDIVAWQPRAGKLATWLGQGFCLDDHDWLDNPATWWGGGALRIHRSPLEWLRADRDGIVIVQPRLSYPFLRNVPRLSFADRLHAQRFKRWLQPPKPKTEILIEVPAGREAA